MGIPILPRTRVLMAVVLGCSIHSIHAQSSEPFLGSEPPVQIFRHDFNSDALVVLEGFTPGPGTLSVDAERGIATLPPAWHWVVGVSKCHTVRLTIDLVFPPLKEDGETTESLFGCVLSDRSRREIRLHRVRQNGSVTSHIEFSSATEDNHSHTESDLSSIQMTRTTDPNGKSSFVLHPPRIGNDNPSLEEAERHLIRKFSQSADLPNGEWAFSYHHGLMLIAHAGKELWRGYLDGGTNVVTGITWEQRQGGVQCRSIQLETVPHSQNSDEERALLQEAGQLNVKALSLRQSEATSEALVYARQASDLYWKVLGEDAHDTATSFLNLASALEENGLYSEAREHYERAMRIRRNILGATHPDTAIVLALLGKMSMEQEEYERACKYFEEALPVMEKSLGRENPLVGGMQDTLSRLGHAIEYEDVYRDAVRVSSRKEVITAVERLKEAENPRVADRNRKTSLALEALRILRELPDSPPELTARAALVAGRMLEHEGRSTDALLFYEYCIRLREDKTKSPHPDLTRALMFAGNLVDRDKGRAGYKIRAIETQYHVLTRAEADRDISPGVLASIRNETAAVYVECAKDFFDFTEMVVALHTNAIRLSLLTGDGRVVRTAAVLLFNQFLAWQDNHRHSELLLAVAHFLEQQDAAQAMIPRDSISGMILRYGRTARELKALNPPREDLANRYVLRLVALERISHVTKPAHVGQYSQQLVEEMNLSDDVGGLALPDADIWPASTAAIARTELMKCLDKVAAPVDLVTEFPKLHLAAEAFPPRVLAVTEMTAKLQRPPYNMQEIPDRPAPAVLEAEISQYLSEGAPTPSPVPGPESYSLGTVLDRRLPARPKFVIPNQNRTIPTDWQPCVENLKKIDAALQEYRRDHGQVPQWLSDLVPNYLSQETLFCPNDPAHKASYAPDPKLPCSYSWQLSPSRPSTGTALSCRDWKAQQAELFGGVVPMVRCAHHNVQRVLNLSLDGQLYWSPLAWENMFKPDYRSGDERGIQAAELTGVQRLSSRRTPASGSPSPLRSDGGADRTTCTAARLSQDLAIYMGCGEVAGPGTVVQLDGTGKVLGTVHLPDTPYGLAVLKDGLVAALPGVRSGRVVKIDNAGKVETLLHDPQIISNPIAIAADPNSGDILVADNHGDVLLLLPSGQVRSARKIVQIKGYEDELQGMSVAFTRDNHFLFGGTGPYGIYRFGRETNAGMGQPVLPDFGTVAADPFSKRWVAASSNELRIFEDTRELLRIPYPPGTSRWHHTVAFGPDGTLVIALHLGEAGYDIALADQRTKTFDSLFSWNQSRIVSLVVGQKGSWKE